MTTNFHTAKKGDRVWSVSAGWGTIDSVYNNRLHPIFVKFDDGRFNTYTLDGRITKACDRDLFWDEVGLKLPAKPTKERRKVRKPTHTWLMGLRFWICGYRQSMWNNTTLSILQFLNYPLFTCLLVLLLIVFGLAVV